MEELKRLYKEWCGDMPECVEQLPGAGSNRVYYRFYGKDGTTVVGVTGTSTDENEAFIYLASHFSTHRLPVPRVLAVSSDRLRYLQTDLGHKSLFDALKRGRESGGQYSAYEKELLKRTIAELPNLQFRGARGLDFNKCYPQPEMDVTNVFFDLHYFKYCFLKPTGLDFHEVKLENDFRLMAKDLVAGHSDTFLYRDFQARNVMLVDGDRPVFIDFQGGRKGPVEYDVASFLWQASAHYSPDLRRELVGVYLDVLQQYMHVNPVEFGERLRRFVLFRILQVLGAYGFRGYFEGKRHFLDSIVPAIRNLSGLLAEGACPYPYLHGLLTRLTEMPRFAPAAEATLPDKDGNGGFKPRATDGPASRSKYDGQGPLVVRVFSFSYRKGIPADESGNGGGYVFDCRSTHNPGRYEPYKALTGLDEPVIRFLEDDGEILTFLDCVYKLADAHVARYIRRGFTSLMFSFGCTGGQHRSVYSAQHLAEHIHRKFGVEVHICHREQHIEQILPAASAPGQTPQTI